MWVNRSQACARPSEQLEEKRALMTEVYVRIPGGFDWASYEWRTSRAEVGIVLGGVAFKWALMWR
jgi:hypothetical protein